MTPNIQMEEFSLAYISAVAAVSGCQVIHPRLDHNSVDGMLRSSEGRQAQIDFQAKATSQDFLRGENIHFPLKKKNYEDLRDDDIMIPRILIVVLMPREPEWRLTQTPDELCLRHCGYWISLEGWPAKQNKAEITVHIPTSNIFDRSHLRDLMTKAGNGSRPLC